MSRMKSPPHPGRILKQEILEPLSLSTTDAAKILKTTRQNLSRIVNQKGSISAEMALKLSKAFQTDIDFWLSLQQAYDIAQARKKLNLEDIEIYQKAG